MLTNDPCKDDPEERILSNLPTSMSREWMTVTPECTRNSNNIMARCPLTCSSREDTPWRHSNILQTTSTRCTMTPITDPLTNSDIPTCHRIEDILPIRNMCKLVRMEWANTLRPMVLRVAIQQRVRRTLCRME